MERDRDNKPLVALTPDAWGTGANAGATIDRRGFDGNALFMVGFGTPGSSATADVKVQESDDASTWADVTGAVIPQQTTAAGLKTINVRLRKRKRYLRLLATVATAAFDLGAMVTLSGGKTLPAFTPDIDVLT